MTSQARIAVLGALGLILAVGTVHRHPSSSAGAAAPANQADSGNVDFPRFPSLSPDGTRMVFSWRGDLWLVPSEGGEARRITSHPADELRSAWTPDASRIVFESNRDGQRNLWTMRADGTNIRQLTALDTPVTLATVGRAPDGTVIVTFDANRENDFFRGARPYFVPLEGGPIRRVHDAFGSRAVPSEDGSRVLFERGGASWSRRGYRGADARDVWMLDHRDGTFRQLTSWEGNDGFARWGRNDEVLYLSDAEGGVVNVFARAVDAPAEAPGRRLTSLERDARDLAVSQDGRVAVFGSWDRLFRLDPTAGSAAARPIVISASEDDRSESRWRRIDRDVTEARLNPDGKSVALVAYGDLFVRSMEEKALPMRITDTPWRESQIAWSPDGLTLYFTSDESGREQIHAVQVQRTRSEVRKAFTADAGSGAEAAGAVDGTHAGTGASAPPNGADTKGGAEPTASARRTPADWGEAISFELKPVITGDQSVRSPDPSPDGTLLAFRRGPGELWLRTLATGEERRVRAGWDQGLSWRFSPDGRWLAIQQQDRDFNNDIWIVPVDGSAEAVNITRHPDTDADPRWSADGRILAFRSDRVNNEFDIWLVALDKSLEAMSAAEREKYLKDAVEAAKKRKPLSAGKDDKPAKSGAAGSADAASDRGAAGATADDPADSGESKSTSADDGTDEVKGRATGASRAKDAKEEKPAPPPVLSLDDAYLRLVRVTTMSGNEGQLEITPGGDRLIFTSSGASAFDEAESSGGEGGLLSVKWDGSDQKRLGAGARVQEVSLTGDRVLVIREGRPSTVPPGGGESKSIDFVASTRIDPREQMRRRFIGVAAALGEGFYHPTMKGLDWPNLTAQYLELAQSTRTADEFDDVAARFVGELNASHLGVTSPAEAGGGERRPQGRLGVRTKPVADGFEIISVIPDSPAAKAPTALAVGDVILAIDGTSVAGASSLEERLAGRVNEEVVVRIRRSPSGGAAVERDALIVPISAGELASLIYRERQLDFTAKVHEWSNGRIGYIHIQSMDQPSLDRFERDLYAAAEGRDGLIIDVRNNGGGWTADRLLASIMAPVHAYTVPRGADPDYTLGYPRDRLFIQRYTLPITMLANEKSFSNAEIIAHAFRTLERGTLVGETTGGGVISTGSARLLDGTTVRMPFRGWYLPDGRDMENNGAVPHIRVPQTPEDESRGEDAQLRRGVEELLGRLGPTTKRSNDG